MQNSPRLAFSGLFSSRLSALQQTKLGHGLPTQRKSGRMAPLAVVRTVHFGHNAEAMLSPQAEPLPLLYVDDEASNLELFQLTFGEQYAVRTALSGAEGLELLDKEDIGLILTDERMPGMSGIEFLERVVQRAPDSVRVIVSAYADADRLLRAINRGHAHEYILKPWNADDLRACLDRGLAMVQRRRQLLAKAASAEALHRDLRHERDPNSIIGEQGGLREALSAARRAADSDATVLLLGETGTGKELVARAVHDASPRATGPFIAVNSAALAEGTMESELFGHEKGAFTGAHRGSVGRFELANRGTLFLDEIGDISQRMQVALLRAIQEREFCRVGGTRTIRVDVRLVVATHRDLEQLVEAGDFRRDLYYRLNVLPITIPPLRQRPQDIPALIGHFVRKYRRGGRSRRVDDLAVEALQQYAWPGNVRELENVVQRALVLGHGDVLTLEDFCLRLELPAQNVRQQAQRREVEELRRQLLEHGGNLARVARTLGVPRTTLVSRAKKYGLI